MMDYSDFSNHSDVIDSRDVIAKIDDLKDFINSQITVDEDAEDVDWDVVLDSPESRVRFGELCDEAECGAELDELLPLIDLESEASGTPDWTYGETLIRDSYFEEYAEQLAEDVGAISRDATWPLNRIDWEAAANDLKMDYFSVDFDGVDYWIRS